ncbi:MAG: D-alanyl-D-alanine carboxypeptidase [Deltaproteobacteria bacterium]|nr:D-alanyl-D-alanine carboxypeptidase [Deltaproteobacteria bacterium]
MKIKVVLGAFVLLIIASAAHASLPQNIARLLGSNDSLYVADEKGREIYSYKADEPRVPASTIKVLTAIAALETLGADFRFPTDFYARGNDTIVMKGYGDPFWVSEVIEDAACGLGKKIGGKRPNLVLDDTYFQKPMIVPGAVKSTNPYDSPVGALCANFNTVMFRYGAGNQPESDEDQTPLIPFAESLIRARNLPPGRVLLAAERGEATLYAGNLFSWFYKKCGNDSFQNVALGAVAPGDKPVYRSLSPYGLEEMIGKLLATSSNFMTNQIFLAAGAKVMGAPASFDKGAAVVRKFAEDKLGIKDLRLVEGSGLSRENRMTARQMDRVLARFYPYRGLMKEKDGIRFKTGTLTGISGRAGYVDVTDEKGGVEKCYRVTVFCNSGNGSQRVIEQVARSLRDRGQSQDRW